MATQLTTSYFRVAVATAISFVVAVPPSIVIPGGILLLYLLLLRRLPFILLHNQPCTSRTINYQTVLRHTYNFYVYILARPSRNLYAGLTDDLPKRLAQHRELRPGTHTARYNITRLVFYEHFQYIHNAIAREKELKSEPRAKKIALIEQNNPTWEDLSK